MSQTIQVRQPTVMDDETRQIARVYAEALFKAASSCGQVETVLAELDQTLEALYGQDSGLGLFFESATITRERKAAVIQTAFATASETLQNFLGVLNEHNRMNVLRSIIAAYRQLYNRARRQVEVEVTSAVPLTQTERSKVIEDVRAVAQVEAILKEKIEPEILGGLIVRVGDWVYDASLRTKLETIRNQLIERSGHGIERQRDRLGS
ncbi:MAG: ATP synthase F1 subunit delta [Gemmataceae bacterium]